jgi:nitrilase
MGDSSLPIMSKSLVKVGAVQAEPGWLDLQLSVNKTIAIIEDAATQNVNVLGFPEVWIPGYPWCVLYWVTDTMQYTY